MPWGLAPDSPKALVWFHQVQRQILDSSFTPKRRGQSSKVSLQLQTRRIRKSKIFKAIRLTEMRLMFERQHLRAVREPHCSAAVPLQCECRLARAPGPLIGRPSTGSWVLPLTFFGSSTHPSSGIWLLFHNDSMAPCPLFKARQGPSFARPRAFCSKNVT